MAVTQHDAAPTGMLSKSLMSSLLIVETQKSRWTVSPWTLARRAGRQRPLWWSALATSQTTTVSRSTSSTTMSFRMVSGYNGWAVGDQERPSTDRSLPRGPPCRPSHSLAVAGQNAAKSMPTLVVRDWFLDMLDQWRTAARGMQRCLCEVQRGLFNGPLRWKLSAPRAAPLGRKALLSPADMTLLSEHTMRFSDILCLSPVVIRGLVREWLDAEGLDVRAYK